MKIWDTENLHYTLSPLLVADVKRIEEELKIEFPKAYIDLLTIQNGGSITYDSIHTDFENTWSKNHLPFTDIYGITYESIMTEAIFVLSEWGISGTNIVIGSGEGTYIFYLNYKINNESPSVWYFDTSSESTKEVASSFEDLLSKLYTHDYQDEDLHNIVYKAPSFQEIYEKIGSEDKNEVFSGYLEWIGSDQQEEELINSLLHQIETSLDHDMLIFASEELTNLFLNRGSKYLSKERLIAALEKRNHPDLAIYIYMLREQSE